MGIFRKVGDWLTEKSDRFIRGESEMSNGYYGSREAEQAYSNMGAEQPEADHGDMEAGEDTGHKPSGDPFGYGGGEYGGRVPYRSRYDREREAQQQPQQPPYQQQPSVQQPIQAQGMQMGMQPPVQRPMAQQQMNMGQQPGYAQGYAQQPMGNVVPFPGMQRGQDGSVYAHVEYIVLLRSRNECKDVIAYIKLNASVFLNMEFIASDNERQRCVDMLSGAAYTLGCALNKISPRGIYLISSPSLIPLCRNLLRRPKRRALSGSGMRTRTIRDTAAISRVRRRRKHSASGLLRAFLQDRQPRASRRRVRSGRRPPALAA